MESSKIHITTRVTLIFLLVFGFLFQVKAQRRSHYYEGDLKQLLGSWVGEATSDNDTEYYLEMTLDTIYPNYTFRGSFYVEIENEGKRNDPYYAFSTFYGELRRHKKALYFIFTEDKILNEYSRFGWGWCLTGGRLDVKLNYGSALILSGKDYTVKGDCGDGYVQLLKWIPKIDEDHPKIATKSDPVPSKNPSSKPKMVNKSVISLEGKNEPSHTEVVKKEGKPALDSTKAPPKMDWGTIIADEFDKYRQEVGEKKDVEIKEDIIIDADSLIIEVWDEYVVDGDTVSLFMNGMWILRNHRINQHKKVMVIRDLREENTIILHAENLGSQPPNTAAITIFDGRKRHKMTLSSEESKSEAIRIRRR